MENHGVIEFDNLMSATAKTDVRRITVENEKLSKPTPFTQSNASGLICSCDSVSKAFDLGSKAALRFKSIYA